MRSGGDPGAIRRGHLHGGATHHHLERELGIEAAYVGRARLARVRGEGEIKGEGELKGEGGVRGEGDRFGRGLGDGSGLDVGRGRGGHCRWRHGG